MTAPTFSEMLDNIERQGNGLRRWLDEHAPQVFDEQKHARPPVSPEQCYWHYGRYVAIRDFIAEGRALLRAHAAHAQRQVEGFSDDDIAAIREQESKRQ